MALSSDTSWTNTVTKALENILPVSEPVKNASVLFRGSFCSRDTTTGDIKPYDGTVTDRAVGWHFGKSVTGNSAAPRVTGRIIPGGFTARYAVTGLNSTALSTDSGKPVYISDDGTYTLTGTTATMKVGAVMGTDSGVTVGTDAWIAFRNMHNLVGGE